MCYIVHPPLAAIKLAHGVDSLILEIKNGSLFLAEQEGSKQETVRTFGMVVLQQYSISLS